MSCIHVGTYIHIRREYVYTRILMYTSRVGGSTYVEYPHIRNVMYTRRYIHIHARECGTHVYVVSCVCYYTRSGMQHIRTYVVRWYILTQWVPLIMYVTHVHTYTYVLCYYTHTQQVTCIPHVHVVVYTTQCTHSVGTYIRSTQYYVALTTYIHVGMYMYVMMVYRCTHV